MALYLVKELEKYSKHIRVSLVHFVEENHRVGTLTKSRGELTSLIITDVAGRSSDQLSHLHVRVNSRSHI